MKNLLTVITVSFLCFSVGKVFANQDDILAKGEEIFLAKCDYCHGRGMEKGAVTNLERKYKGKITPYITDRTDLTAEFVKVVIRTPTKGMAPIRYTEVTDEELDWLIAYLTRNNQ